MCQYCHHNYPFISQILTTWTANGLVNACAQIVFQEYDDLPMSEEEKRAIVLDMLDHVIIDENALAVE